MNNRNTVAPTDKNDINYDHFPYYRELSNLLNYGETDIVGICGSEVSRNCEKLRLYAQKDLPVGDLQEELQQVCNFKKLIFLKLFGFENITLNGLLPDNINQLIANNIKFNESQDFSNCINIHTLNLGGSSLKTVFLPDSLSVFRAVDSGLEGFQDFSNCEKLDYVNIIGCSYITGLNLPDTVTTIKANYSGLSGIQDFSHLTELEELDIRGCSNIEKLIIPKGKKDKVIGLEEANEVEEVSVFMILYPEDISKLKLEDKAIKDGEIQKNEIKEYLEKIKILKIHGGLECITLNGLLPDNIKKIIAIDIKFDEAQDFSYLHNMKSINLEGSMLGNVILPDSIEVFRAVDSFLSGLQDFSNCEKLDYVNIIGCSYITGLNLPNTVTTIKANHSGLCGIQDFSHLRKLEELDIRGCSNIEKLIIPKGKKNKVIGLKEAYEVLEV